MTSPFRAIEIAIVVPTYKEARNVAELVRRVELVLEGYDFEIIFVDDDSPDGTSQIAREIGRTDPRIRCLRRVGRRGLAGACVEGMLSTNASVVAVMDGDLQHDESVLPAMLEQIRAGHDLVVASRNIEGGSKDEGLSPIRRMISDLGRKLANYVMKAELSDPMSGFFMIRRELVEEIAPASRPRASRFWRISLRHFRANQKWRRFPISSRNVSRDTRNSTPRWRSTISASS